MTKQEAAIEAAVTELPFALIRDAENNSLFDPIKALNGTVATISFAGMGNSPITLYWAIKDQPAPTFDPIVQTGSTSGSIDIDIPWQWVSTCIGKTVLIWYTATVAGRLQESKVLELEIQHFREDDLKGSLPVFANAKLVHNTWTLDMHKFRGDETIRIKAWPMIQKGQRLFVNVAGDQHKPPFKFSWVAFDHQVTAAEAHPDHVFEFSLSRFWMAGLEDYSALTAHMAVNFDGADPLPPAPIPDPIYETQLPENAPEFTPRTTTQLRVDPALDLPVPWVRGAENGVLDFVELCCADASLVVGPWPDIATTHRVWLDCEGTSTGGGGSITVPLIAGRTLTPSEVRQGLDIAFSSTALTPLRNDSDITLELRVAFPGEEAIPFTPVKLRLIKSQKLIEGFDGQPNKLLATGESITTPTMTITMVQAAKALGGIYTFNPVAGYLSGPGIVMCYYQSGFAVPPQITDLQFKDPCKCLRFAYSYLDGDVTLRFYDQDDVILETRILNSSSGGRHQWVDFKAPRGKFLSKMQVETGDHSYLDNFSMCGPVSE